MEYIIRNVLACSFFSVSRIRENGEFVLRATYELYWAEAKTLSKPVTCFASGNKVASKKSFVTSIRVKNNLTGIQTNLLQKPSL
jgi:hypothetical protein